MDLNAKRSGDSSQYGTPRERILNGVTEVNDTPVVYSWKMLDFAKKLLTILMNLNTRCSIGK